MGREPRYCRGVPSTPASEPRSAGAGAQAEDEDSQWVRSFLLTWWGKTYRVGASDEAREDAGREALAEAARALTDRVLLDTAKDQDSDQNNPPPSGPS